jgi:hypothetical protein
MGKNVRGVIMKKIKEGQWTQVGRLAGYVAI